MPPHHRPITQRKRSLAATRRLASGVLVTCLAILWPASRLQAQTAAPPLATDLRDYDIPAGQLTRVLEAFIAQSGALVSMDGTLIQAQHSNGLRGSYPTSQALNLILAPHALHATRGAGGIYTLSPLPGRSGIRDITELEAVDVVGQADDPKDAAYRAPQSMNVLTQEDIERFRGTSVGDIFQGIPGVLVGENRNSGGLDINIRGMQGQGRVPVLVDGARQETTVYRGYQGAASRSYVDPDLIGGITIEKGPTMSAGGEGATGGLVSMRTIEANDVIQDPDDSFGIRIRGQLIGNNSGSVPAVGTPSGYSLPYLNGRSLTTYRVDCTRPDICWQTNPQTGQPYALPRSFAPRYGMQRPDWYQPKSWAGSLALAKRFESIEFIAAVSRRQQGNYHAGRHGPTPSVDLSDRDESPPFYTLVYPELLGASRFRGGERVANTNYESHSSLLKSRLFLPADQQLDLSWLRYQSEYGELMSSQLWFGNVTQTGNSEVTANTYTARYRWTPAAQAWIDLRANLWHTDTKSMNILYAIAEDENGHIQEDATNVYEHYRRTGLDLSNTSRFEAWGSPEIRYGMALQREDIGPDGDPSKAMTIGAFGLPTNVNIRDGERQEYNLFAALKWELLPTLTLDAGIRHTRYKAQDHKGTRPAEDSPDCTAKDALGRCAYLFHHQKDHGTTPLASLTWEPRDGLQLYIRYAEAMRMPSLFENTQGVSVSPTLGAELKPEHARNREIGLNLLQNDLLATGDRLRFKAAYFRNQTKDYLTRTAPNNWEVSASNLTEIFRLRNIDSASFHGGELSLEYDMGAVFLEAAGTKYTKIEICHHGSYRRFDCTDYGLASSYVTNMIPPNWHAAGKLGLRLFDRRLTLGVRGTFMGTRNMPPAFDDTRNGMLKPVAWHAYRIFDFFAGYRVNDNLSVDFNLDNFTDRYYLDALSLGMMPAPGRTARLSATLQF
ncbi:TonB-dependent receptor domain-containing protein [Kerstersia similis]|uniref:TonB-dependent receptor n=1 Tax=Kerstersia similis TaxID=206505 RepID=UPI0039EF394F